MTAPARPWPSTASGSRTAPSATSTAPAPCSRRASTSPGPWRTRSARRRARRTSRCWRSTPGTRDAALPLLAEAEHLDLELGDAWGVAADRLNLAAALLAAGRPIEAAELLRELASTVTDHGDPDLTLSLVELLAVAASVTGDHERAVRLASCADEERTQAGMPLAGPDRAFLDRHRVVSRAALGEAAAAAEADGRALDVADALAEAAEIAEIAAR